MPVLAALLLLLAGRASALPGCGSLDKDLEGRRVEQRTRSLRPLQSSGDEPRLGDPNALAPGFPDGFTACWADPRLRAYNPDTLAALTKPGAYAGSPWPDGVVLDSLALEAAVLRHGSRFYFLLNPSADAKAAAADAARLSRVAASCREPLARPQTPGWALVRLDAGGCAETPLSMGEAEAPAPALASQRRAALERLRAAIVGDPRAPAPGRWVSYCWDPAASAYRRKVPPEDWSDEEIADRCALFGNNGAVVEITLDGPKDWRDWISLLDQELAPEPPPPPKLDSERAGKKLDEAERELSGGFGGQ